LNVLTKKSRSKERDGQPFVDRQRHTEEEKREAKGETAKESRAYSPFKGGEWNEGTKIEKEKS